MNSERHPLEPFLPENARLLMLGSFPPKRIRWSMEFFYPNLQNDMWRIVGYLATGDKMHFLEPGGRRIEVAPELGGLEFVSGVVPSAFGPIRVTADAGGEVEVKAGENIIVEISTEKEVLCV